MREPGASATLLSDSLCSSDVEKTFSGTRAVREASWGAGLREVWRWAGVYGGTPFACTEEPLSGRWTCTEEPPVACTEEPP